MTEDRSIASRPQVVAVVGVGRIGLPVVANLVRAGHHVRAFDVRPEMKDAVTTAGGTWAASASTAVVDVDVLVTVLPGSPELRSLMLGDGSGPGLLDLLRPETAWLDLTSAAPDLGAELSIAAPSRGIGYLDAAIGGGADAAQRGELTLYVGGDRDLLELVRPVLTAIAARIEHMGGAGSGYLTKLLVNLLWFGQAVATGEALLLARSAGLDPVAVAGALGRSPASSEFIRNYLPSVLAGDYLTTFGLDRCVEELDSLERLAAERGMPFELSRLVGRMHRDALAHFGPVDGELMAVAYLEDQAGMRLGEV